jgi:hypothetical protein
MLNYRDMTFCEGDGCTKFRHCPRALTDDVRKKAEAYGLPVAYFINPRKQPCHSQHSPSDPATPPPPPEK